MQISVYKSCYSSKFKFIDNVNIVSMNHIKKLSLGAFYDENGNKIVGACRAGGRGGDHILDISPMYYLPSKNNDIVRGRSLYLGPNMSHYGHFIIETLSRMWIGQFEYFDNIILSPFIFGIKIVKFQVDFFKLFGIPLEKIKIIDNEFYYEELYIPDQLWKINEHPSKLVGKVYDFIRKFYLNKINDTTQKFTRIMLSDLNENHRLANKSEIQEYLSSVGYKIIYPELLSFEQVMFYYTTAKYIVTLSGTLAHNALFFNEDVHVFEILDQRTPKKPLSLQEDIYLLREISYEYIEYTGKNGHINIENIKSKL